MSFFVSFLFCVGFRLLFICFVDSSTLPLSVVVRPFLFILCCLYVPPCFPFLRRLASLSFLPFSHPFSRLRFCVAIRSVVCLLFVYALTFVHWLVYPKSDGRFLAAATAWYLTDEGLPTDGPNHDTLSRLICHYLGRDIDSITCVRRRTMGTACCSHGRK